MRTTIATTIALLLLASAPAEAIPRTDVMAKAKAFAFHPWRCTSSNLTASCDASYKSFHIANEDYMGLPYDWGGYLDIFAFDRHIAEGYGAGSEAQGAILSCTTGVDCSGFVSKCWDVGHYTTRSLGEISSVISQNDALAGDAFNDAGTHVILFSHTLSNGDPIFYEAGGYNTHETAYGGWSRVAGYVPLRYQGIEGYSAADPVGTTTNPIKITSFPYSDARDTREAVSDVLDGCAADPAKQERGYELIYQVTFPSPGTVTASVTVNQQLTPGADVDVHLYGSLNTSDCIARDDLKVEHQVDCGTYYVVVDTYGTDATADPGAYALNVDFAPSSSSCGSGPPTYSPRGELGDACAYPGNANLPYCNENLGGYICIYSNTSSFCSLPCETNDDCTAVFPGGCCRDLTGKNETFCLTAAYCGITPPTDGSITPNDSGPPNDGEIPEADGASPSGDGASPADGAAPQGDGTTKKGGGGGCNIVGTTSDATGWLMLVLAALFSKKRRRS